MRSITSATATLAAIIAMQAAGVAQTAASIDLLRRAVNPNPTLQSYTAIAQYTITPGADNGSVSTYTLVPKKQGSRVKSITLTVNDASALVSRAQWAYTNGGSMSFDQTYLNAGTYRLPAKANISARFPGYSVDGTLTFTNYHPNAPVSPAAFTATPAP